MTMGPIQSVALGISFRGVRITIQTQANHDQSPSVVEVLPNGTQSRKHGHLLAARLAPATVLTADAVGWSADALEAQAFAYLAVRTLRGLPITFPTTTGAPKPMTGGVVARP